MENCPAMIAPDAVPGIPVSDPHLACFVFGMCPVPDPYGNERVGLNKNLLISVSPGSPIPRVAGWALLPCTRACPAQFVVPARAAADGRAAWMAHPHPPTKSLP